MITGQLEAVDRALGRYLFIYCDQLLAFVADMNPVPFRVNKPLYLYVYDIGFLLTGHTRYAIAVDFHGRTYVYRYLDEGEDWLRARLIELCRQLHPVLAEASILKFEADGLVELVDRGVPTAHEIAAILAECQ